MTDKDCKECPDREVCGEMGKMLLDKVAELLMRFVILHKEATESYARLFTNGEDFSRHLIEVTTKFVVEYGSKIDVSTRKEADAADQHVFEFLLYHIEKHVSAHKN